MKRSSKSKRKSPLIRLVGLEVAVAATGLAGSVNALAAPGDLDPAFGEVGRSSVEIQSWSSLESVDVADDDSVLFGGGGEYCYYSCYEDSFFGSLLPDGTTDSAFLPPALTGTIVRDTALQPDGKLVGVGRTRTPDGAMYVQVFRLLRDGSLDTGFGIGGQATISNVGGVSANAYSVAVDPDGRIVVTGFRGTNLFVARFLDNGTLDPAFATGGVYVPALPADALAPPLRIVRAPGGGYRVLAQHRGDGPSGADGCAVRALTADGAVDAGFGLAGVATVLTAGGATVECDAMAFQPDGKLLLGGRFAAGPGAFLGRLLATGGRDPDFDATAATAKLDRVRAIGVGGGGAVLLAGSDPTGLLGVLVQRLQPSGALDPSYGRNGTARVDVQSSRPGWSTVSDLKVLADGRVVVAGNADSYYLGRSAFVARLLAAEGAGPGVLGIRASGLAPESQGAATLTVQRSGGRSGSAAVTYTARAVLGSSNATSGLDFAAVTGRLTWADGDDADREIVVPIAGDTDAEPPEWFEVVLSAPEGGAGLGTYSADVEIADFGYPQGAFTIWGPAEVQEGSQVNFAVFRNWYAQGAVSVTVRVASGGTATPGTDFGNYFSGSQTWSDVVLSWADGELGAKQVTLILRADRRNEPTETFGLELADPTGGAVLDAPTRASISIQNVKPVDNVDGGGGGGGGWGGLGTLLLALGGLVHRFRNRAR